MRDIYNEIAIINANDPASESERMCKLSEETGELATEINKINKRKFKCLSEKRETIVANILEEGCDVIQNTFSLLNGFDISYEEIMEGLKQKNIIWKKIADLKNHNMLYDYEKGGVMMRYDDFIANDKAILAGLKKVNVQNLFDALTFQGIQNVMIGSIDYNINNHEHYLENWKKEIKAFRFYGEITKKENNNLIHKIAAPYRPTKYENMHEQLILEFV